MDTFEERNTKHSAQENEEKLNKPAESNDQKSGESQPHNQLVGLAGGQPKDDDGGLDVSDYTGPHSKAGAVFDDAERPVETGAKLNRGKLPTTQNGNPNPTNNQGV